MVVSRHQNARQSNNFLITNKPFENIEKLKYLGTTATIQNSFTKKLTAY